MERLAHVARTLMLLDVERLAHDSKRIHRGVFAKRDRHTRKRAAVGAVAIEVSARDHRGARARRGHAVNGILAVPAAGLAPTFAITAATHHWTLYGTLYGPPHAGEADRREARDRIGEPTVDEHRGPLDTTRGEPPMRPGLVVGAKIEAEHLRERVAVGANRRAETYDETVEVVARETGVVERARNRFAREIDRAAHQAPAVGRIADSDNRRAVFQREVGHSSESREMLNVLIF